VRFRGQLKKTRCHVFMARYTVGFRRTEQRRRHT